MIELPGLSFDHGEEIAALRAAVADFAQREIAPRAHEIDRSDRFPQELWRQMGALGLLGITVEEEYGGAGLGYLAHIVAMEEISRASAAVGLSYGAHSNLCVNQIRRNGSAAQKARYLPRLISGEAVGALAMSESGAGSDVVSMRLRADRRDGGWVLNGSKMWITNGSQADFMCMLANTSEGPVHKNKSLIVVPMKTKGVTVARTLDKLGMRSSDTAQIFFEDVRVPKRYCIGEEGQGFIYQMGQFQYERLYAAAKQIRAMECAIEDTITYTRERKAFGKSLLDNQVIHFKLAELQSEVEALRSLVYRAVELVINGEDVTRLASMAKLKAGRLVRQVADNCLQYYGGMGFMNETPISRMFRDTRLASIGGGADEIMLTIISKYMGILPRTS